jgi:hypothetical protein
MGSLWCTSDFSSSSDSGGGVSSSSATSQARSGCNEVVWWQRFLGGGVKEMVGLNDGHFIGTPS